MSKETLKENNSENLLPKAEVSSPQTTKSAKADAQLTRLLRYLLDKQIHFVVIALAVLYLVYSWYSTQARYAQLESNTVEPATFTLVKNSAALDFNRDGPTNRPLLQTTVKDALFSYNDLDSSITINGTTGKLWDYSHTYQTDAANAKFYQSIQGDKWVLFEEVTLGPNSNSALVEYYFRNDASAFDVTLQLSHEANFFIKPQTSSTGFKASVSSSQYTTPQDQINNPRYNLSLNLNSLAYGNTPLDFKVTSDSQDNLTATKIFTLYTLHNVPIAQRTLIASETITWQDVPLK